MRAAQVSASASGRQLHGFFPGVVNGESGVFATRSADGVAWERPVRLLASEEIEHRTQDHPVGLHAHASEIENPRSCRCGAHSLCGPTVIGLVKHGVRKEEIPNDAKSSASGASFNGGAN